MSKRGPYMKGEVPADGGAYFRDPEEAYNYLEFTRGYSVTKSQQHDNAAVMRLLAEVVRGNAVLAEARQKADRMLTMPRLQIASATPQWERGWSTMVRMDGTDD